METSYGHPDTDTMVDIIVIEDSDILLASIEFILREHNWSFISFKNANDFVESMFDRRYYPRLIVSDYNLGYGSMDGIDMTRLIKSLALFQHIPIIMLSSENSTQVIRYAKECGIAEWVDKLYITTRLPRAIEQHILPPR